MNDATATRAPLGLTAAVALVVGTMIGSGVFLLPATLAPYGAASSLGWALSLGGSLAIALVLAWLASGISRSGGPYAYARAAFGDGVGFAVAWSYWICVWTANAALAVAFAGSLGALFPALTATPLRGAGCALAALIAATAINALGVREMGRTQIVLTALKLVPLLLFGVVGLAFVDSSNYVPPNPGGQPLWQIASAAGALTMWAFLGLEAASIPSGAIRDPQRNVPRATIIGVLLAGLATMLACTVVIGMVPREQLQASAAPMAEAARIAWGAWAGVGVAVVACISVLGALNSSVFLQAQMPLAAARDGVFPGVFGRLDGRGMPLLNLLIGSGLASALMLTNYTKSLVGLFAFSALLATATCLLPYAVSAAAWWRLDPRATAGRKGVAVIALAYSLWALWGTGSEALLWGAGLVLAGLPVYLLVLRSRARGWSRAHISSVGSSGKVSRAGAGTRRTECSRDQRHRP
jgi:APA family basic amino acid/polyamine antiporter